MKKKFLVWMNNFQPKNAYLGSNVGNLTITQYECIHIEEKNEGHPIDNTVNSKIIKLENFFIRHFEK